MRDLILAILLFTIPCFGQFRELGTITITNGITWDANQETNLIGYKIFSTTTNRAADLSSFKLLGSVPTNAWPGTAAGLSGWHAVAVKAYGTFVTTNVSGPTIVKQTNIVDSDFSERVLVLFDSHGRPTSPSNLKFYEVIRAASTNSLTPVPPIPNARQRQRGRLR